MSTNGWTVRTICGSMRYYKAMLAIADTETQRGAIILMPFVKHIPPAEQDNNPLKQMLDEMHFTKIDMSDGIVVVGSHIGKSTTAEIEYAQKQGKEIIRYTDVDHLL